MKKKSTDMWLTTGKFSQHTQLSRKALRLYDDRGLLKPIYVDPETGYRYYGQQQIIIAERIRLLRLMEMSLEEIALIIDIWDTDRQSTLKHIHHHLTAFSERLAKIQVVAKLLREDIFPPQEKSVAFEFVTRTQVRSMMLSIRRSITIPDYHSWMISATGQLKNYIDNSGARVVGDPIAFYYGPVNEEDDGPVEIGLSFEGKISPQGTMKIRELAEHRVVCIQTYGEFNTYPKLLEAWYALGKYIRAEGLGSNFENDLSTYEIWHTDGSLSICWPII